MLLWKNPLLVIAQFFCSSLPSRRRENAEMRAPRVLGLLVNLSLLLKIKCTTYRGDYIGLLSLEDEKMTFELAEQRCQSQNNAHLVEVTTEEEWSEVNVIYDAIHEYLSIQSAA